jgi:hypothetical protein
VDLDEHYAFVTNLPERELEGACKNVQVLHLIESYCPFFHGDSGQTRQPRITIAKQIFPTLRCLTVDHGNCMTDAYITVAPLPSVEDVPRLLHLAVHSARLNEETVLDFVKRYGQAPETLSIQDTRGDAHKPMLNILRPKNLKKLTITHEISDYWEAYGNDPTRERWREKEVVGISRNLQKERIKRLAEEVVLLPPKLVKAVERFRILDIEDETGSGEEI